MSNFDIFQIIGEARHQKQPAVLLTVVAATGATPRKAGARMLLLADGSTHGTIGGGKIEFVVLQEARRAWLNGATELKTYDLGKDLGMHCGGHMSVFIEPLQPPAPLVVFGCGHVGTALINQALSLDFAVTAVDELVPNANPGKFPRVSRIINSYHTADLENLPFGKSASIVIVTREHRFDQSLVEFCAEKKWLYLGVIGSRHKARTMKSQLAAKGISQNIIDKIHCPVGLAIGAETPEEIAISICAELVKTRRRAGVAKV